MLKHPVSSQDKTRIPGWAENNAFSVATGPGEAEPLREAHDCGLCAALGRHARDGPAAGGHPASQLCVEHDVDTGRGRRHAELHVGPRTGARAGRWPAAAHRVQRALQCASGPIHPKPLASCCSWRPACSPDRFRALSPNPWPAAAHGVQRALRCASGPIHPKPLASCCSWRPACSPDRFRALGPNPWPAAAHGAQRALQRASASAGPGRCGCARLALQRWTLLGD